MSVFSLRFKEATSELRHLQLFTNTAILENIYAIFLVSAIPTVSRFGAHFKIRKSLYAWFFDNLKNYFIRTLISYVKIQVNGI